MSPERILVVDDDKEIVRLVRAYLEQAGYQVLTAYDGRDAWRILQAERPDLLVLDLMMPEIDGWELTQRIRREPMLAAMPIIMLTARVDDTDKVLGLELGADDYVTKPFNPREVVARVRAQLRRVRLLSNSGGRYDILTVGPLRLDVARHEATLDGKPLDLTPTEFKILQTMMMQPGYAFTRAELIEQALGYSYEGLDRTLDSHIKNLRRKIEPDPKNPTFIQTVYGVGYRLNDEIDAPRSEHMP